MQARRILIACLWVWPSAAAGQQEADWHGRPVAEWIAQLESESTAARWYATYAVGQIGPRAGGATEPLAKILVDRAGHEYVRGGAAWALGRVGAGSEVAAGALTEALGSERASIRRQAACALGNLGAAARPAIPRLTERLRDDDAAVRVQAAVALWRIDRDPQAMDALAEIARQPSGIGPYQAVVGLGEITSQSDEGIRVLVAALRHADPDVGRAAARALGQLGLRALPAIKQATADPNPEVRRRAVEALGWMGEAAVPALGEALRNQSPAVRRAAALGLGRLGPAAQPADSALVEVLDDADAAVREAAAWALGRVRRATGDDRSIETGGSRSTQ